jgi:hypothetical protein
LSALGPFSATKTQHVPFFMQRRPTLIPERGFKKKRRTEGFQVFCVEKRPDLTARNPQEPVGAITSRLAAMWRAMSAKQKRIYADYAKQFDNEQALEHHRKPRPPPKQISTFPLPMIHIVRRVGSSDVVERASLNALMMETGDAVSSMLPSLNL